MRKIKNMNYQETKDAFSKWEAKHPRNDDFNMSGLAFAQCGEIAKGIDREATVTMLYDIFNYGFMAGYKQSEADLKEKIDKRVKDDMHRRLLELVYFLPLGIHANFFYTFMIRYMGKAELEYLFPKKLAKSALEVIAADEAKYALEKAEREEKKKVIDEALKQYEQQKGGVSV